MKKLFFCLLVLTMASTVISVHSDVLSADLEISKRSKLTQERARIESEFALKESACYKNFVVDACLRQANTDKRSALAEIKRQELAVNDLQRQKKKAELEKKVSKPIITNQPVTDINLNVPTTTKALEQEKKIADAKKRLEKTNQKISNAQIKAAQRLKKSNSADQEMTKYQKKLSEAEEHKVEIEQRKLLSTKPKAASLPIPQP